MKTIKFSPDLVPLVLSGEKTSTWRLFDDKNISVADELVFVNKSTGEIFGYATVKALREKKFGEIRSEDFDGHEKFPSMDAMFETYKKYYGDKVDEETIVKIISFSFSKA